MTGVIENMPVEARLERLKSLAEVLLTIVRQHNGSLSLTEALSEAASQLRTAISQVKQGLNYALSTRMLRLDADDTLTAAA